MQILRDTFLLILDPSIHHVSFNDLFRTHSFSSVWCDMFHYTKNKGFLRLFVLKFHSENLK
jgi:hypothetical protein